MADEYWVLGEKDGNNGKVYPWSTSSLGTIISGITFTLPGSDTIYTGFQQAISGSNTFIYAYNSSTTVVLAAGSSSSSTGISFINQANRIITIKSIDTSVITGAYWWIKGSYGKGVKHDFLRYLKDLSETKYSALKDNTDTTTTVTAKATGFAPSSATSNTWKK